MASNTSRTWTIALWIVEGVFIALWVIVTIGVAGYTLERVGPLPLWGLTALIMIVLLALAGHEINGQWAGVLIDTRNKFSLSRLQITLWTVMALSAYFTIAIPRILAMLGEQPALTQQQALDIRFPEPLILAMGISAASFAGSGLIQSNKKSKQLKIDVQMTPENAALRRDTAKKAAADAEAQYQNLAQVEADRLADKTTAKTALDADPTNATKQLAFRRAEGLYDSALKDKTEAARDLETKKRALETAEQELTAINEAQGLLHKNASPQDARWVDLVRGEEIANYTLVDMSKVQMLFFTLIVVSTYAAAIAGLMSSVAALRQAASVSLPEFSQTMNALLGISHATYLSVKSIDK